MYNIPERRWQGKPNGNHHASDSEVDRFIRTLQRSKRTGNLWRRLSDEHICTIFKGNYGGYCWCLADADGPRYSPESYDTIEEAAAALLEVIEEEGV